jgi:hypothetical protein
MRHSSQCCAHVIACICSPCNVAFSSDRAPVPGTRHRHSCFWAPRACMAPVTSSQRWWGCELPVIIIARVRNRPHRYLGPLEFQRGTANAASLTPVARTLALGLAWLCFPALRSTCPPRLRCHGLSPCCCLGHRFWASTGATDPRPLLWRCPAAWHRRCYRCCGGYRWPGGTATSQCRQGLRRPFPQILSCGDVCQFLPTGSWLL